jgi:hypothetical protein
MDNIPSTTANSNVQTPYSSPDKTSHNKRRHLDETDPIVQEREKKSRIMINNQPMKPDL